MMRFKVLVFAGFVFASVAGFLSCASLPAASGASPRPEWVRDPYTRFDRQTHLAAVGSGSSRQQAERDALGRLVAIFGQSIQVDERVTESYQQAMNSGTVAAWAGGTTFDSSIVTSTGMDTLIGAEIGDFWEDGRGNSFALAVLDRAKAIQIYSQMLNANQEIIDNLVNVPASQRNTFDGFARYQFAAVVADMNTSYAAVLQVLGAPAQGNRSGDEFRRSAQEIAAAIPIGINVSNDRNSRIRGAFAGVFSGLGFRTGAANQRYMLNVDLVVQQTDTPNAQGLVFARMEFNANLVDTTTGAVLLPFTFNVREGHRTMSEAENRVFIAAERKINSDYEPTLSGFLSSLVPSR